MTELSQMIRWNTGFMRGLAESVLNRAKLIRSSLTPYASMTTTATPAMTVAAKTKRGGTTKAKAKTTKGTAKRTSAKSATRKGKRVPTTKQ